MNEVQKLFRLSGKTQKKLSAILGVTETTLSRYKTGKRQITVSQLKEWCEKLDIDIKNIFC